MFKAGGMIPVRREAADLHALREAQEALKQGRALGMFPEGHRSRTGGLQTGEPGSALIALRSGAPILPIAIWGTENVKLPRDMFLRKTQAHVTLREAVSAAAGQEDRPRGGGAGHGDYNESDSGAPPGEVLGRLRGQDEERWRSESERGVDWNSDGDPAGQRHGVLLGRPACD